MLAFVSEFHYPVRMNAVSGLVKESLPNYLQALPIPNTVSDVVKSLCYDLNPEIALLSNY